MATAPNQRSATPLPTPADVRFYEAHGYWVTGRFIPDALLAETAEAAERWYRGERDAPLPLTMGFSQWTPGQGEDVVRNDEFVSLQSHGISRLARHEAIGEIAGALAQTSRIRLLDDQLVYKPAAGREIAPSTAIGWHADHAYWPTCSSNRLLTAWIPFDDVDEDAGTLMVLDGSHRWKGTANSRFFNEKDLDRIEARLARRGEKVIRITLRLRRGQVSFHHGWTIHGSLPNRSDRPRLALAVHLQDRDNRYTPRRGPDGKPLSMIDEKLCRRLPGGEPDFADPAVFPVIWPARER